ncbi:MBL fold metallo-hydrolase [Actinocorallia herbida]|nr:MBL fold metallo-hydrolase [Actinocorallia herbida]
MSGERVPVQVFGGPTALIEYGGLRFVTDPTFDEPGEYPLGPGLVLTKLEPPTAGPDDLGRVDVVLLSHDQHPDNLDNAGRAFLGRVPLVLTTPTGAARLGGAVRGLEPWTEVVLDRPDGGTVTITAVPALHGPEGAGVLEISGEVTGFVLTGEGLPVVYVSGDNASLDLVRQIAVRVGPVDTAVLFAGAARTPFFDGRPVTLDSASAAEAARILAARRVVPVHVDGWGHFTEDRETLVKAFTEAGLADRLS